MLLWEYTICLNVAEGNSYIYLCDLFMMNPFMVVVYIEYNTRVKSNETWIQFFVVVVELCNNFSFPVESASDWNECDVNQQCVHTVYAVV